MISMRLLVDTGVDEDFLEPHHAPKRGFTLQRSKEVVRKQLLTNKSRPCKGQTFFEGYRERQIQKERHRTYFCNLTSAQSLLSLPPKPLVFLTVAKIASFITFLESPFSSKTLNPASVDPPFVAIFFLTSSGSSPLLINAAAPRIAEAAICNASCRSTPSSTAPSTAPPTPRRRTQDLTLQASLQHWIMSLARS